MARRAGVFRNAVGGNVAKMADELCTRCGAPAREHKRELNRDRLRCPEWAEDQVRERRALEALAQQATTDQRFDELTERLRNPPPDRLAAALKAGKQIADIAYGREPGEIVGTPRFDRDERMTIPDAVRMSKPIYGRLTRDEQLREQQQRRAQEPTEKEPRRKDEYTDVDTMIDELAKSMKDAGVTRENVVEFYESSGYNALVTAYANRIDLSRRARVYADQAVLEERTRELEERVRQRLTEQARQRMVFPTTWGDVERSEGAMFAAAERTATPAKPREPAVAIDQARKYFDD